MQNTLMGNALAERDKCDAQRPPKEKYPPFSTTLVVAIDANGNGAADFIAQRDTLFVSLSVDGGAAQATTRVNASYCNTKLLVNAAAATFGKCCASKPYFVQGVADNKRLQFQLTGADPNGTATVTLVGAQGNGCCG